MHREDIQEITKIQRKVIFLEEINWHVKHVFVKPNSFRTR